ncbi:UNVERIFIED_CONTAM: hypothetical protein ABID98_004655 [Brevibacillus sp. OAP136]
MAIDNTREAIAEVVERWYEWLCSQPNALFHGADIERMRQPAHYFHHSIDWLSKTTLTNTDWFLAQGSNDVKNRWLRDDYDVY